MGPLEPAARARLWARTGIHTFTHTEHRHTEQLVLFATAAGDSDNMCFVPCVCVCVCKCACAHKHMHSYTNTQRMPAGSHISGLCFIPLVFCFFFQYKKRKQTVFIDTAMLDLKALSECTVGNF